MLISTLLFTSTFISGIFAAPMADAIDAALPAPLVVRNSHKRGKDVLGATYFITNRPAQTIIISTINSNGSLSFAKEFPTGGAGGFAVFMNEVDVLFSQDSLLVSDNMLFVVNPGDNTFSTFKIDENDPTHLTPVGGPTPSGGQFPVSIAYSKKHKTACILNSGGHSNLACFCIGHDSVTPIPNTSRLLGSNQTTPPANPFGTVSDILFNQDETQIIVSVKGGGSGPPGFLATFKIVDGEGFKIAGTAVKSTPVRGMLPFGMTLVGQEGNVVLDTDPAFGVSVSKISESSGLITSSASLNVTGQKTICWSSFSPKTGNYYLTDAANGNVTEVAVHTAGPTVSFVASYTIAAGAGGQIDQNVGSTKKGDFLYILSPSKGIINVLKLVSPGHTEEIQSFGVKTFVPDLPITLQGMAVYVKEERCGF